MTPSVSFADNLRRSASSESATGGDDAERPSKREAGSELKILKAWARRVIGATGKPLCEIGGKAEGLDRRVTRKWDDCIACGLCGDVLRRQGELRGISISPFAPLTPTPLKTSRDTLHPGTMGLRPE